MEMTPPGAPWAMIDGESGAIRVVGRSLAVRQTAAVHERIVAILNMLDESENSNQ